MPKFSFAFGSGGTRLARASLLLFGVVGVPFFAIGCGEPTPSVTTGPPTVARGTFTGSKIRTFTDTYAVTALADGGSTLWVGSPHGLLKWDLTGAQSHYTVVGAADGLPADRINAVAVDPKGAVWVATAKGLSHGSNARWQNLPAPPVGDFVTGLVPTLDGTSLWVGGAEGLAHLRGNKWDRYLSDVPVTALMADPRGGLWVGTSGHGVLRITRSGDTIEAYGASEGCDVDNVRGITLIGDHLLVIGDGPGGARAALFDGARFWSYQVGGPQLLEWTVLGGTRTFVGGGNAIFGVEEARLNADGDRPPASATQVTFTARPPVGGGTRSQPLTVGMVGAKLGTSPAAAHGKVSGSAPILITRDEGIKLPDGVTVVGSSARGILVGTRFVGTERIENGVVRHFRASDLTTGAERITVACSHEGGDECFLATGGGRAWRFDGQSFELAQVDPEPRSRVLAVVSDPGGKVLAIHRGGGDPHLRVSTVNDGHWAPIALQTVKVPVGVPDLNFARFSPTGHLWLGLRFYDKELDPVDYGAAEVTLDTGATIYHRQDSDEGLDLPNDTTSVYFKSETETWFATRSGAVRVQGDAVRVFTENDNLQDELIADIGPGPNNEVWVASRHGTGRYDGKAWTFPKLGPFYLASTSLGHDDLGHVFIGTDKGLFCVGDCPPYAIDAHFGLLDDAVLHMAVDARGRVWVLGEHGICIVER